MEQERKDTRRSCGKEPCLSDFSGFVNEKAILVSD